MPWGAGGPTRESAHLFLAWLGGYTATTLAYSLVLKRKVLLDVFVLSGLYTLRLLAGAALTHVPMSAWLASFSVFLFLSLAFVKRFSELEALQASDSVVRNGRGYLLSDLEQLRSFGTGAGCAAAVVLSLYIHDADATRLYRHSERLWLVVPLLLLWLFRIWILASRGKMDEDPVVYAITDRRSLLMGVAMAAIVLAAL
jgi:4-hydroxybenzoate polyprenyltransferase